MKTKHIVFLVSIFCLVQSRAQNYSMDSSHSAVQIQVERFGVVDVIGRFKEISGTITFDPNDNSKTTAVSTIKTDSYDANNIGGENAVKSQAFLDIATYPEIRFKGLKTTQKDGKNYLEGYLTIHGTTKAIELPYTIKGPLMDLPTKKQSIAFNSSITINRQDYGISFDRQLPNGIKLVGDDVKINLTILAIAE